MVATQRVSVQMFVELYRDLRNFFRISTDSVVRHFIIDTTGFTDTVVYVMTGYLNVPLACTCSTGCFKHAMHTL